MMLMLVCDSNNVDVDDNNNVVVDVDDVVDGDDDVVVVEIYLERNNLQHT